MAVLTAFIGYQVYRVGVHFSWMLLGLAILDVLIVLLIWHEYHYVKRHFNRGKDSASPRNRRQFENTAIEKDPHRMKGTK